MISSSSFGLCITFSLFLVILVIERNDAVKSSTQNNRRTLPSRNEDSANKFNLNIKKGCDFISFPNATINECGFCVGADTGLELNYGKDCNGVCFGSAVFDCMGVCGGKAYVDECTGRCTAFLSEPAWNTSANRDCRGMCAQPTADLSGSAPMPSQQYSIDQCGICRLSSGGASSSQQFPMSRTFDCNGECQLPGLSKSREICGHCVRTGELENVIDDCGNCISEGHPCSCDRDPAKCGCIDPNNCYIIKAIYPQAIPRLVQANVSIVGYFYPYAKELYCVIRRHGFESVDSFPVQFLHKNKTVAQCNLHLIQEGEYVFGLGFRKNVFITPPKDLLHLYAYDALSVNVSLIGPAKSLTNDSDSLLTIHFSDLTGQIPPIPVRCKLVYETGEEELANFGVHLNSCTLPRSVRRSRSQIVRIFPTFDGVHLFGSSVEHLIQATAPKMFELSSFVSEDGLSIVITFDKPVDLTAIDRNIKDNGEGHGSGGHYDEEPLLMCDYLFSERTIEHLSLYGLQGCRWATRIQLIITIMRPLSSESIEVAIKPGVLLQFDQKFALSNEEMIIGNVSKLANWWSYEPMLAITGPNEISVCGEFALIGQFSSPRGTHEVDFQWEVTGGEHSAELKRYVTRNGKSTNLLLGADMFEIGVEYTFTLKAFIHARRLSLQRSHTLIKLPYETPIVTLYHTRLLHNFPFYENENLTLLADVKLPDCIFPPQRLILAWRVSDPKFRFPLNDFGKRYAISYTIEPFSVPPNHETAIILDSYVGLQQNKTSSAIFHFDISRASLKANLAEGINKITIGSQSGMFWLKSRQEPKQWPLVYQWSCHEVKTAQPCFFNFASVVNAHEQYRNPLLFTSDMQHRKEIFLPSNWFQVNQQYLIGLQLFDANNSKITSETEYTLLSVVDGAKPQVSIGPVYIKGKYAIPYNTRFSTFLVPFGASISIRGRAFLQQGVKFVRWESNNFRYPLSWSSRQVSSELIETELYIHEDSIMAYGQYNFKLEACNHQMQCSSSDIALMAAQSTTMCNPILDSYIELEQTSVNVEKCNIPPSASPVTYQLFLEDEHFPTLLPINGPQLSPVMVVAGTPVFSEKQSNRLAVRVCDRFDTCTLHFSQPISVEYTANLTAAIDQLVFQAHRLHKIGDPINAIAITNSIFLKPDSFNESYRSYEAAINATIDFGVDALQMPMLILAEGHYEMIFNALSFSLLKTNNLQLRRKLLSLIARFYEKAEATQAVPSISSIRVTYSNVMNAFVSSDERTGTYATINDPQYLRDIRATFSRIKKATASQLPLGSRVVLLAERLDGRFLDNDGQPVRLHTAITEIVHMRNAFDVNLRARLSANQTVTAHVQFGEEVKQNLNTGWNCKQTLPCTSVVYSVTMFPNESPYPSNRMTHRLSPVLDIAIQSPKNGEERPITSLLKATVFEVTVTGNASYGGTDFATKCHYFDEKLQQWRMDDVHPLGIAYNQVGCWSGHLSTFVVLRTALGINSEYIIGVIVACLMGVLVFGMMLVFYVQRKRDDASINPEVHKTVDDSNVHHLHQQQKQLQQQKPNLAFNKVKIRPISSEIQTQTILITD